MRIDIEQGNDRTKLVYIDDSYAGFIMRDRFYPAPSLNKEEKSYPVQGNIHTTITSILIHR